MVARGGTADDDDRPIHVSTRNQLSDAILSVGFAKSKETIASG